MDHVQLRHRLKEARQTAWLQAVRPVYLLPQGHLLVLLVLYDSDFILARARDFYDVLHVCDLDVRTYERARLDE